MAEHALQAARPPRDLAHLPSFWYIHEQHFEPDD
jgi:hypothetical protein